MFLYGNNKTKGFLRPTGERSKLKYNAFVYKNMPTKCKDCPDEHRKEATFGFKDQGKRLYCATHAAKYPNTVCLTWLVR